MSREYLQQGEWGVPLCRHTLLLLEVRRRKVKAPALLLVSSWSLGSRSIEIGIQRKDGAVSCEINKKQLNSEN